MIKIQNEYLEKCANEHYEHLKSKLKEFPSSCQYSLEEVIKAKPDKLDTIAEWVNGKSDYNFMIKKYENFTTKKKEYDAYDLAKKLNVNVCPYCNINSTYTVIKEDGKKITRPEFDHFYDKATYPILALSFYNLIPSCHICNATLKGTEKFSSKTHINPYANSFDEVAKFHLKIEDSTFYYSIDGFDVKLETEDKRAKNQIKSFELDTLYTNHKDIVLELIQKEAIYNESYLDELLTQYEGTLFKNKEDLQRLIGGGYVSDDDLHKRPLSKLIRDISKELGLV
jgi:uncharacterized protein (TIGR02646 family)